VLDFHLPDGTGDALLAEFHQRFPAAATIMTTADPRPDLALDWMNKGAGAFVRKPFEPEYLLRLCEHLRRERSLLGVEDVLEQRTRQLREQEEKYRIVADFALDWEYWIGPDGQFRYMSPSCERFTGYRAEDFYHDPSLLVEVVHREDRESVAQHLATLRSDRQTRHLEFRVLHRCGKVLWIDHWCQPVSREDGTCLGHRAGNRDITERKLAEEAQRHLQRQLQEARHRESLAVMAGGLAHDFNNLIMVIQGNAALAAQELPAQSVGQQTLQQVNKACQRAAELCRQMLAYSGQGQLRLEQLQLTNLVESLFPLLSASAAKRADLKLELSPDLPAIHADAAQIRQIVLNLVANSVEAVAGTGGLITVSTGLCECRPKDLQGVFLEEDRLAGQYVWLEVADNGCGMDVEQQRRIFEPFYTTKFVGRGVGLSAVLGIVRAHQGVLKVSSALGQGSTFRALFPAAVNP